MSPATSTARPDLAIIFALNALSMPAIPMAGSKPPIVVGIKQTSKATRVITSSLVPTKAASGKSVTTINKKISVKTASKIERAISFGVFWRFAPSTRAIMRSRKLSPGNVVTLTTISSEMTLVPPVTLEKSPPASRNTGALSPVMALSSTIANPSTISPSIGIKPPAVTRTLSPS